jgi:hypothetical protein
MQSVILLNQQSMVLVLKGMHGCSVVIQTPVCQLGAEFVCRPAAYLVYTSHSGQCTSRYIMFHD